MGTVNGWRIVGRGEKEKGIGAMKFQSMGKNFCPNFPQPSLEDVDWRSCNNRSQHFRTLTKKLTLSSGGGSYLGVWRAFRACRYNKSISNGIISPVYPVSPKDLFIQGRKCCCYCFLGQKIWLECFDLNIDECCVISAYIVKKLFNGYRSWRVHSTFLAYLLCFKVIFNSAYQWTLCSNMNTWRGHNKPISNTNIRRNRNLALNIDTNSPLFRNFKGEQVYYFSKKLYVKEFAH